MTIALFSVLRHRNFNTYLLKGSSSEIVRVNKPLREIDGSYHVSFEPFPSSFSILKHSLLLFLMTRSRTNTNMTTKTFEWPEITNQ